MFFSFFYSLLAPSRLHFGAFWAPKLAPFWPNMRPSRLLKPHFFQKSNFQKNERHAAWEHEFDPKAGLGPRSPQDGPKTVSRRSSRAAFFIFVFVFDFGSFRVRFWVPFGRRFAATPLLSSSPVSSPLFSCTFLLMLLRCCCFAPSSMTKKAGILVLPFCPLEYDIENCYIGVAVLPPPVCQRKLVCLIFSLLSLLSLSLFPLVFLSLLPNCGWAFLAQIEAFHVQIPMFVCKH